MKKLFNYALLAAALLVGVNVNAQNNCMVQIGEGQPQAANFVDVLTNINGADYINQSVVITLSEDISITNPNLMYDQVGNKINDSGSKYYDFSIFPGADNTIDVTIDLNGKSLQSAPGSFFRIRIFKGKLTFTGKGTIKENIQRTDANADNYGGGTIFAVAGTAEDVSETYAELVIDKDVTLISELSYGVGLFYASYGKTITGETESNVSNGAVLTIKGTIQANSPVATNGTMSYMEATNRPDGQFMTATKYPVVNIESTAVLIGDHSEDPLDGNAGRPKLSGTVTVNVLDQDGKPVLKEDGTYKTKNKTYESLINAAGYPDATQYLSSSTCVYAPGYAIYNIKGRIEGGIGIYAKAGKLNIDGAVIKAVSEHYYKPIAYGNGCIGSGSALVLDSHAGYGKFDGATISNSTVSSDNGYAIEETVTAGAEKLPDIVVNSGTFVGGQGAVSTTAEERQKIQDEGSISGGEWHNTDVTPYLDPNKNTVLEFTDADGKHYQVVVPISKDDMESTIADAAANEAGERYAYIQENVNPEVVDGDITIDFLLVDSAATVIVKSGVVLDAGTLMTEGSQIAGKGTGKVIVEAGGTLIVSGKQGAYTYNENSIVINAEENNPGRLLINPDVVLNTTPKATVHFVSKSYRNSADDKVYQFFGSPMLAGKVKSVEALNTTYKTDFNVWRGTEWENMGMLQGTTGLNVTKFDNTFGFYSMLSNNPNTVKMEYVFKGNLFGNTTPQVGIAPGWTAAANGFTGDLNLVAIIGSLNDLHNAGVGVEGNVYTCNLQHGTEGYLLVWSPFNELRDGENIQPMLPFMFHNEQGGVYFPADYRNLVWRPSQGDGAQAPKKGASNIAKATIRVSNSQNTDIVTIAEDEKFTSEDDFGYDAVKYINGEFNLYVSTDNEPMDIYATNDINNTTLGLLVSAAGKYTISFENVTGDFDLIDLTTNARIAMAEGTTYEFLAEAGDDANRFMIVAAAKAPTAMEKTNAAVKANKALVNGQIVISNGERFFNVLGTEVK